jgi:flagellar hook-basal body complex protein FliE
MPVNPIQPVAAYANAVKAASRAGDSPPGKGFADLLGEVAKGAVDAGLASEATSVKALTGEIDLDQVVTAVTSAEVTLQTVVALRDRVIQAYQEIVRMPI